MTDSRIFKSNLHTHTCFCDGDDTPEQIVQAAISLNMEALGFSGHSYTSFDLESCMTREKTLQYRENIRALQKRYAQRIHILLGLEQDFYADDRAEGYDYIIGSVHCLKLGGKYPALDLSRQSFCELARDHFGGDFYRLAQCYYETVAQVAQKTGCDIVGHFDLVTKYNEGGSLFDENDPRYWRSALECLDALLEKDLVFEINTGAILRGHRNVPYPSPRLLRRIAEKRGRVTLSSDAHRKEHLLGGFEEATLFARECGLRTLLVMTRNGWQEVPV